MKSFGPVFKMALPGDEQLALVADPELIEQVSNWSTLRICCDESHQRP
jgi:hypothetical protein